MERESTDEIERIELRYQSLELPARGLERKLHHGPGTTSNICYNW
jgi:hypothetical protein